MALYEFFWGALAWTVTIVALWPVNIPLAYLAYRIWSRNRLPPDTEWSEIWLRSTLVTLVIALVSLVVVVLDFLIVSWAQFPVGPIHLTLYVLLLAAAVYLLMQFFEIEDFFEAFSLLVIYVYLPFMVLWPLNRLLGFWQPLLGFVQGWLLPPTA